MVVERAQVVAGKGEKPPVHLLLNDFTFGFQCCGANVDEAVKFRDKSALVPLVFVPQPRQVDGDNPD